MKKKVYEYFREHPYETTENCARALNINGFVVMRCVRELRHEGYINGTVCPLGNDYISDCSNFYLVRKTPYNE